MPRSRITGFGSIQGFGSDAARSGAQSCDVGDNAVSCTREGFDEVVAEALKGGILWGAAAGLCAAAVGYAIFRYSEGASR